jgi:hypothetical protein
MIVIVASGAETIVSLHAPKAAIPNIKPSAVARDIPISDIPTPTFFNSNATAGRTEL